MHAWLKVGHFDPDEKCILNKEHSYFKKKLKDI